MSEETEKPQSAMDIEGFPEFISGLAAHLQRDRMGDYANAAKDLRGLYLASGDPIEVAMVKATLEKLRLECIAHFGEGLTVSIFAHRIAPTPTGNDE